MDTRIIELSQQLTRHSCNLQAGENVLIEYEGDATLPLVRQLIKDVYQLGCKPYVVAKNNSVLRSLLLGADEQQLKSIAEWELSQMKEMDAFIGVRGGDNISELSDVSPEQMRLYYTTSQVVLDERISRTKWVILRYPNPSMAQLAGKSLEGFSDHFFDVCTMDYQKLSKAMDALVDLMDRTDRVRLTAPGTDLSFSIKGIPARKCDGKLNIPDGEVFTAPVKDSMNGVISYNVFSEMQGFTYENICFEVKDGKIIKASANDSDRINAVLDTDDGSRYFGEFAIGVNPYILEPIKDILFDEKICGSFHLTPGDSYEEADNGNHSALHWDLILIQRPEHGGGEIWFDDVLIRKDGEFILDELKGLNPENLK